MSSDGNNSDSDWSDDRGVYENLPRDDESVRDNGGQSADNEGTMEYENPAAFVGGLGQSRNADDRAGDSVEGVGGDVADVERGSDNGDKSDDNEGTVEYKDPAAFVRGPGQSRNADDNAGDSVEGVAGDAPDVERDSNNGDESDVNEGTVEYKDPASFVIGTDKSRDANDKAGDGVMQFYGHHNAAETNVASTIVAVDPPTTPPAPLPAEDMVEKSGTSIQVHSISNHDDIGRSPGGHPYTTGANINVADTARPSIGGTPETNVVLIPITDNDESSPSDATAASSFPNGDPGDGFSAYYSKTPAATTPTNRGFVVVVPIGSTPSPTTRDVTSGSTNVPTSVSTSGNVTTDKECGRSLVYQSDTTSQITSNDTTTIVRIGGGKGITANGDVVSASKPTSLPHNGVTVLSVGMPQTQYASMNDDAAIINSMDVNHQAGKSVSGSSVFTPGLHADTPRAHSPTASRATYTKGQSHANGTAHINDKRQQRPPAVSPQQSAAFKAQWSGIDPALPYKYSASAGRLWVVAALVVCIGIVLGVGIYFVLMKANVIS